MRPEELEPLQTRDAATESDLADLIDREFAVIGERLRRVDGTGKVTGHAIYADDLAFPGMLHDPPAISDSTAHRDRGIKRERYAHYGVPEYWIVETNPRTIDVHRPQSQPGQPLVATQILRWTPVPDGPTLELSIPEALKGFDL